MFSRKKTKTMQLYKHIILKIKNLGIIELYSWIKVISNNPQHDHQTFEVVSLWLGHNYLWGGKRANLYGGAGRWSAGNIKIADRSGQKCSRTFFCVGVLQATGRRNIYTECCLRTSYNSIPCTSKVRATFINPTNTQKSYIPFLWRHSRWNCRTRLRSPCGGSCLWPSTGPDNPKTIKPWRNRLVYDMRHTNKHFHSFNSEMIRKSTNLSR